jgi:DNA mismatch endonuclease, patch repair protein
VKAMEQIQRSQSEIGSGSCSADCMAPAQRRRAMAHNRGRTGPERALASELWRRGQRFLTADGYKTRYGRRLEGNPDLVFPRKRVVIFLDGCFWHGCAECERMPTGYRSAWVDKIGRNMARDRQVTARLQEEGWVVLRVPEHDVRTKERLATTADGLASRLRAAGGTRSVWDQEPRVDRVR